MIGRIVKLPEKQSFFLFGARGTGKTTLLKNTYPDALYINLLNASEEETLSKNPDLLIQRLQTVDEKKPAIIDEVQKVPKLLDVVQILIDSGKRRFILTGSSARKLKHGSGNLLAGRAVFRALFPFTECELKERFELDSALRFGTLPALIHLDTEEEKIDFLQAYVRNYIKEEVLVEQLVRNLNPFRNFLEVAGQMNGRALNFSNIERDVGVTVKTIQNYYQILCDTHLGFFVNGFHESWRKQLSKAPKFYFFDTGVCRALTKRVQINISPGNYEYGNLFEQFIIAELHRLNEYLKKEFSFSYLLSKDGAEIDLIIERPGLKRVLVEIKSSNHIHAEDIRHIIKFRKEHVNTEAFCLSLDQHNKIIENVNVLYWKKGIKEIGFG